MLRSSAAAAAAQIAALIGLAVSVLLVAQYSLPLSAGGCPVGGGCHVVRACTVGGFSPGTWPLLGTAGFLFVLPFTLAGGPWARRILRVASLIGAAVGVALLVSQKAVCGAFCPYCLVTDLAAIVVAISAWAGRREPLVVSGRRRAAIAMLALAATGGTIAWATRSAEAPPSAVHLATLPPVVEREQRPGVATIVEFMDFTCPHCRQQHPELLQAVSPYGARARIVRRYMAFVPAAENAARAAYCAEAQGQGEPMLEALLAADDLSRSGCGALAQRLHLDVSAFHACLDAPETTARFEADRAASREALIVRLPTLFVGHDRYEGTVPAQSLRASIDVALDAATAASVR